MNRSVMSAAGTSQRPLGTSRWRAWLPLLPVLALVGLLFRDTLAAMVGIWSRSDTFAHAFLVPPIALWLMWRMRESLRTFPVRAAPVWLLPMAAACVLWLLGWLAGVAAATQFAVVAMLVLSVPLVLGAAVARQLAFPLLFLFFCVPFGDFLVEPMMEATADFTVLALRLSGIPVYREGLQFVIPTGNWSVVEACSGVRYLIASFMVGTLFAALNYRSRKRQLLFVALSLVVPVVANWLRAYMIVMLGHFSGNKLAVGADHLIYGWVFFGVVILIMFSIGARFADDHGTQPTVAGGTAGSVAAPSGTAASGTVLGHASWSAAAAAALLLLATQAVAWRLDRPSDGPAPQLALPIQLPGGWAASDEPLAAWAPVYSNPSAVDSRTYRLGDAVVAVWVALYRDQGVERKLVTSTNVLVPYRSVDWLPMPQSPRALRLRGESGDMDLRATVLRSPADPKAAPRRRLLVLQVYRVGGQYLIDDAHTKLLIAKQRLLGRGDDGAVLMFYAETGEAGQGAERLHRFVSEHLPTLAGLVDNAAKMRP